MVSSFQRWYWSESRPFFLMRRIFPTYFGVIAQMSSEPQGFFTTVKAFRGSAPRVS